MMTPRSLRSDPPERRRRPGRRVLAAAAFLMLAAGPVSAIDFAVGADAGWFDMTNANRSAKAIFGGTSGGGTAGGILRLGLGESFFVSAHVRYFQRTGERVFVAAPGGDVFRLGHPLTLRLIPAYAMLGYRFGHGSRWTPYVAAGAGVTSYHEKSDTAGLIETSTASKPAGHVAAGVEFGQGLARFGAEAMYSTVPNTIGQSGVSKVYGEKDVGGFTLVARVMFGSRY